MTKLIGLGCVVALLLPLAEPQGGRFSKYAPVKTYEISPGVLVMPKYSGAGQLCQAVIQKDHYAKGVADLDSALPRKAITQIFDELAPSAERGPFTSDKELEGLSLYGGGGVTTFLDYKNVSLDMMRPASSPGYIVAVITWKNRGCPAEPGSR
jgi:hypothetical protein